MNESAEGPTKPQAQRSWIAAAIAAVLLALIGIGFLDPFGAHRSDAAEAVAMAGSEVATGSVDAASGPAEGMAAGKTDREAIRRVEPVAVPSAPVVPQRRPVVVVDPGHGGADGGTHSPATGTLEKTVVLEVSKLLVRELEKTGRYDVRTTRTADVFVPLGQRVAFAREAKADLFLSIHADAEFDASVRGATVYTVAEKPSDERAAALAAKENAADAIAGQASAEIPGEVGDILADLTLRETRRFSLIFARDILDEYKRHGRLVKGAAHRQAGLKVLRAHDVPSALVEIGFLTNKEDEAQMASHTWREQTAHSLAAAVDRFFATRGLPGAALPGEEAHRAP